MELKNEYEMKDRTWLAIKIAIFLFVILMIFVIGFVSSVSAEPVTLNPTTISINSYPGTTVYRNISIETTGNFTVYLSAIAPANITINYNSTSPLIVERQKTIQVAFYFPKDIAPGTYQITLSASTDVYVDTPIQQITVVSGGGGLVYRDKYHDRVIPNQTLLDLIEAQRQEITALKNETGNETITLGKEGPFKHNWKIFWTFILVIVILTGFIYLIKMINDMRKFRKDMEDLDYDGID